MSDNDVPIKRNSTTKPYKHTAEREAEITEFISRAGAIALTWQQIGHLLNEDPQYLRQRFSQVKIKAKANCRMMLAAKLWDTAINKDNCIMQIFLAKNMLGYADKVEAKSQATIVDKKEMQISYEQLKEAFKQDQFIDTTCVPVPSES
jgi:hypothetical protein